jgi:hypothetical protein
MVMKTRTLVAAISAVLVGTAMLSGGAFAARPPGVGGGGGGGGSGGGGGETALGNSLSRPTIVNNGGGLTNVTCGDEGNWTLLKAPSTPPEPATGYVYYPGAYWWVQGVHTWQAPCMEWALGAGAIPVTGAWGDNLTGDAKLKAGSPIRVELVLSYAGEISTAQQGYVVEKLQPELLDRVSEYGTLATGGDGAWVATPAVMVPGVYDNTASLRIEQVGGTWVYDQKTTAEINAKGIVVYGYNLRVPSAGTYLITYTVPNVDLTGADAGDCGAPENAEQVIECSLEITVSGGGGGGGGRGGSSGGRPTSRMLPQR